MPERRQDGPMFLGYLREDGRVGTRNYIAVVAASNCAAHTAEAIARSYEGRPLPRERGWRGGVPARRWLRARARPGYRPAAAHAGRRAGASQCLGGGHCGAGLRGQPDRSLPRAGQPAGGADAAISGGTRGTVEAARREIARFIERAAAEKRAEAPARRIVLGLNCGGSDSFSGITANPALGCCSDLLAELGGTPVLAETPEIFGAEHLLVKRARNRQVAEKLLEMIRKYRRYLGRFGGGFDDNPSPGNKAGGTQQHPGKIAGRGGQGRHVHADGGLRLRRAHRRPRLLLS